MKSNGIIIYLSAFDSIPDGNYWIDLQCYTVTNNVATDEVNPAQADCTILCVESKLL